MTFRSFDRNAWRRLNAAATAPDERLTEAARALEEDNAEREVWDIYLPLCRLIDDAIEDKGSAPFTIGIAGSVAAGKSVAARTLRAVLEALRPQRRVELVTTDGFLFPNRVLEERGMMRRKGFPESYDTEALLAFLAAVQEGREPLSAPVYSHRVYDVVAGRRQELRSPDVVVLEGINVLQDANPPIPGLLDFALYIDADEEDLRRWYVDRFLALVEGASGEPDSYFHQFAELSEREAEEVAIGRWTQINAPNLREHIAPTRERADAILRLGADHSVERVLLR